MVALLNLCLLPQQGPTGAQGAEVAEHKDKEWPFYFPRKLENFSLFILTVRHGK